MLKSLCLQENPWENLLGYSVQNVNIRSNHSAVCSESEEKTDRKFDQESLQFVAVVEHSLSNYVTILIHLPLIKE